MKGSKMSDYTVNNDSSIKIPKFIDIALPSGNIVKIKNGTDWKTMNKIGEEIIDFSLVLRKQSI